MILSGFSLSSFAGGVAGIARGLPFSFRGGFTRCLLGEFCFRDPGSPARAATEGPKGCFLMAVNGVPVGWTDPHGASLDWISELPESEG